MTTGDPYGIRRRISRQQPHRDTLAHQLKVEPGSPRVTEAIRRMYTNDLGPGGKEWVLEYFGSEGLEDLLPKRGGQER